MTHKPPANRRKPDTAPPPEPVTWTMPMLQLRYPGMSKKEIREAFESMGFYQMRPGKPFMVHQSHVDKFERALAETADNGPIFL